MALTLAHLREKGFRDSRWTAEDKRDQIQDVIKLHKRDKMHTDKKVQELRRQQFAEIRHLTREVQEYRGLLDAARGGDKQALRNTLRRHRATQLAFMDHTFEKAIEHMDQARFAHSKEMDRLRCLKQQRARELVSLEWEAGILQKEQEARVRQPSRDTYEQALTSQITNCAVKQNAASSVTHTYQKILSILRKDTVYFDAVLGALHGDQVTQCRCVVRATQLGQSAAEDAARLREEARAVEAELKHSMQERALAVKSLRAVVDDQKRLSKSHVRAESTTDLRVALLPAKEDSETVSLLKDLDRMEGLMQRLQATTLVSSYVDVLPRFEQQLRQRVRLLQQVQRRELRRDEVLARRNHAQLILHDLRCNMSEAEQQAEQEEAELRARMVEEEARRQAAVDAKQKLCTHMVGVRTALFSIVLVLNQVKPTQAMVKSLPQKYDWELEQEFVDDLYARKKGPAAAPEANAMAMLKSIFIKVAVLLKQMEAERKSRVELPDQLASRALLPDVVAAKPERADQTMEEIGVLVLDSAEAIGDAKVPTRDSIKAESQKIIRMARKLSEPESYERIKRVRREEKWI